MNGYEFIELKGKKAAYDVIESIPDKTASHYVFKGKPFYFSEDFQSSFLDGDWRDSDYYTEEDLIDGYGINCVVSISELKEILI